MGEIVFLPWKIEFIPLFAYLAELQVQKYLQVSPNGPFPRGEEKFTSLSIRRLSIRTGVVGRLGACGCRVSSCGITCLWGSRGGGGLSHGATGCLRRTQHRALKLGH